MDPIKLAWYQYDHMFGAVLRRNPSYNFHRTTHKSDGTEKVDRDSSFSHESSQYSDKTCPELVPCYHQSDTIYIIYSDY